MAPSRPPERNAVPLRPPAARRSSPGSAGSPDSACSGGLSAPPSSGRGGRGGLPGAARLAPRRAAALACLAVLALGVGLPAAAAPSASPRVAPPSTTGEEPGRNEQETERSRRRILHLREGGVLRGVTRRAPEDGGEASESARGWQIRRDGRWVHVPAGRVERAVLESEVEATARSLARELGDRDHDRRVEYARWLVSEGLVEEALRETDRVLADEPDHAPTLAFLAERPVALRLPPLAADREGFLARAARLPLSARELAVGRLGEELDRETLRADLRAELVASLPRRRAFAALALRRLFPGEEIVPLVHRAVLDPVSDVREAASRSLRAGDDPAAAVVPVIGALSSSHSVVRRHAAETLAGMGHPAAVGPLIATLQSTSGWRPPASHVFVGRQIAYVGDFDVEVAQFAAVADPQINVLTEATTLDARVLGAQEVAAERRAIRKALTRITGVEVSRMKSAWQEWWEENGEAYGREHGLEPLPASVSR